MPVINTRKRKPSTASMTPAVARAAISSLDRLLSVSAHELSSHASSMQKDEGSDDSDSASSYSGDFPLRRMRRTARRRTEPPRQLLQPLHAHYAKRRRVRGSDVSDAADASDASDASDDDEQPRFRTTSTHRDDWCAPQLREEIFQLHATVETMLDRSRLDAVSPLEAVQTVHAVVRGLQSLLSEPMSTELLAPHTRSTLEMLWTQARLAADHEMRAKLTFWKHKAQQLRETLRAAVDANDTQTPATRPVQDALDFVSTFYLLEMAPEDARAQDPAKTIAIATANDTIARQLQQLETQRFREMPLVQQPLASSLLLLSQRPPARAVGSYGDAQRQDESPTSSTMSMSAFGVGLDRGRANGLDRFLEQQERTRPQPPPVTYHPALLSRVNSARTSGFPSSASTPPFSGTSSTPSAAPRFSTINSRAPTPAAAAASNAMSAELHGAKSLTLAARRRLALLLESQLQSKTQSSSASRSPATLQPAQPSSTPPTPAVNVPSTYHGAYGVMHVHQRTTPATRAPPQTASSVTASSVNPPRSSTSHPPAAAPPPGSDDGSDSGISHSGLGCATCGRNDSYSSLLLCDNGCEREFHTFCLQPPLDKIPEGDWYCPKCLATENIQPDSRVYSCSAALCNKITGAKYCSLHRCKFDMCLNRSNAGGFCRRHERYKEPKIVRRASGPSDFSTLSATAATRAPLLPDAGGLTPSAHVVASAGAFTSATTPAQASAGAAAPGRARLDTEQLMNNMRQMGIWLPANLTGNGGTAHKLPAATTSTTTGDPSSAVV